MKNWKTTAGGLATAIGQLLITSPSPVLWWVGKGLLLLGPALLGVAAIDNSNVKDTAKHDA